MEATAPRMQHIMAKREVRKLFSTGEIKNLIGIRTPKTVAEWIDKGILKGVTFPGKQERRVHRDDLRRFLKEYEFDWALRELDIEEGIIPVEQPSAPPKKKPGPKKK